MELASRVFVRPRASFRWTNTRGTWMPCRWELQQVLANFEVSEFATYLRFSLHNRSAPDRLSCVVGRYGGNSPLPELILKEEANVTLSHNKLDRALRPLIGKTVYLQVEYEEPEEEEKSDGQSK